MPEEPIHDDPIIRQSMSGPLLVSAVLLLLSLFWALYDEFYGLRPWKRYQHDFVSLYSRYLEKAAADQGAAEAAVRQDASFQKLEEQIHEAESAVAPQVDALDAEARLLDHQISVLTELYAEARGEVTAIIYQAEVAGSEAGKQKRLEAAERAKHRIRRVQLPQPDGSLKPVEYDYDQLNAEYARLKERKSAVLSERVRVLEHVTELRHQREDYLAKHLVGLSEQQLRALLRKTQTIDYSIKQIHVMETDLVDRCESCHLGIQEPLTLTPADLGERSEFVTHPNPELLRVHDPKRFGCSPCHGGNGRAVSSVVKAHGRHKYWLWPLYHKENVEAGCQSCHVRDMVLEHAEVLNRGKELFRQRGCIGCHRFEGFDDERERLQAVRQRTRELQLRQEANELEIQRSIRAGDQAPTNEEAQQFYARAQNLRVSNSGIEAELDQLRLRARDLQREEKIVGPNLKEVRLKLNRDWIPVWITNPHEFRPTTKMPRFRLEPDQVRAIAAFLWQDAYTDVTLPPQPRGDATRGRELLMTRGCLGCHSIGEGSELIGGRFAANFSRVGEKDKYEYLVRWIHNPRERTRPYCPLEKRDLTPEDYAKHGLPFRFDRQNSTCPNDGEELRIDQMTVMPSLRLTDQEIRDIATFLMTQRQKPPEAYPKADYMENGKLFDQGKALVKNYGCAGCHEIAGLEDEGRIGTDLTTEGSKPVERLDFALLTEDARRGTLPDGSPSPRGSWYDHKGFFEQKLNNPAVFDQGKVKEPLERLRMPKPNVTPEDIRALTTFLLGSVEPGYGFPTSYLYRPEDQRRDIEEGWWIVTKYNCMGCHQFRIGQSSVLMTLPQYQTPDGKEQLPPVLVGVGARLNPDWLAKFLNNPALSDTDIHRNGVRNYLRLRMPTFSLTVNEIQKLVRFFGALSAQAQPYIPPILEPLTAPEQTMARQLFTHPAAPCLKCHATGDPAHDRTVIAPNFLLAKERLKPAWTKRWLLDPASIIPGTAMPSGLFRLEGDRWVFAGPQPESLRGYHGDEAELLVRYLFQITPEEQRRLLGRMTSASPREPAQPQNPAYTMLKSH